VDKEVVDLKKVGGITVLYIWSGTGSPPTFPSLVRTKNRLSADVRFVYVCLAATADVLNANKSMVPIPGVHCLETKGMSSALADVLKVRSAPSVYVFNRKGEVAGIGRPVELPTLLDAALK
jgi:hypothetical protein